MGADWLMATLIVRNVYNPRTATRSNVETVEPQVKDLKSAKMREEKLSINILVKIFFYFLEFTE